MTCRCMLKEHGARPYVVRELPDIQWRYACRQHRLVCLDYCIHEAIELLWDFGFRTLGCCCSHGDARPDVIIDDRDDAARAERILAAADGRDWAILQWIGNELKDMSRTGGGRIVHVSQSECSP